MTVVKYAVYTVTAVSLLVAGCATSPEVESRRQAIENDIALILSEPLDPAIYGDTKRCLSDREYRDIRALGDRRLLFEGRRDRLWLNTLPARCPDLRHYDVLVFRLTIGSRLCNMDTFQVADWFDWPWYRRWPWHWWADWGMGSRCSLGKFQPVTEFQVEEIEAALKSPR